MSADPKEEKHPVLIRVREDFYQELFDEAAKEQLQRRERVSVPSLVVEKLEFLAALAAECPELYNQAKEAVLNKTKN
ncbi:hypothetical protein [Agrobacterium tumefaciens]|uniref:hypothetical protein n=1 Tax=Agrobacterium tumefaciens TaxID=358 RepID=UPI00157349B7|nr:hypothetical protein [Agrobacterium tumefaciens]NTB05914.1 hypothetical protein [Agrobacterium tumefaciens]